MTSSKNTVSTNRNKEQKPSNVKKLNESSSPSKNPTKTKHVTKADKLSNESSNIGVATDLPGNTKSDDTNKTVDSKVVDDKLLSNEIEVKCIIRERKDGAFLVYLDHDLNVRWQRKQDVFDNGVIDADPMHVERILAKAQTIGAMPTPFLATEQREATARIIGEAVALALCGDIRAANQTLKDARNFIKAKAIEKARIWTVQGSLGSFFILAICFSAIAYIAPEVKEESTHLIEFIRELSIAAIFGLIGSQFSVLQRVDQLDVAPLAGVTPHVVEAFSRIFMGALAGIIMYVILRAQLFFGFIDHKPTGPGIPEHWVTWTLVIVAGASERLIPSFMTKIETQAAGDLIEEKENETGKE